MIEAYERISAYCSSNGRDPTIRNHAFCIYIENLRQALAGQENLSSIRTETIQASLLTDVAIEGYVTKADLLVDSITAAVVEPYSSRRSARDFWVAVATSALGSLIYTVGLALLFWLAKDQIRSWLLALSN